MTGSTDKIAALFTCIDKMLKCLRLYEGRGAHVERVGDELLMRANEALAGGDFTVRITPVGAFYEGRLLQEDPPSYLFRLFLDGVRELTFKVGVPREELMALAQIFSTDSDKEDEDFVTLIWKRELTCVRYYATDTLGSEVEAAGDLAGADAETLRGDSEGEELVLSADDLRMLRAEDSLPWTRSLTTPRPNTRLPRPPDPKDEDLGRFVELGHRLARPGEASPLVLGVLDAVLREGDAIGACEMLKVVQGPLRIAVLDPIRLEGLARLVHGSPDRLLPVLHDLAEENEALVPLLSHLPPGAGQIALEKMLETDGIDLSAFYTRRLDSSDVAVVQDAIAALGRTGTPAAMAEVSRALGHRLTEVREAALKAMEGHDVHDARVAVARVLKDPVRSNRLLALKILQKAGESRAAGPILSAVQESSFHSKDGEEQKAFYDALVSFHDPRTMAFFAGVLATTNMVRNAELLKRQLQAIDALASMGTPEARKELEKVSSRWLSAGELKAAARSALARSPKS